MKRKKMTQEELYIHLLKIHFALQSVLMPNAKAVYQAGFAKTDVMARHYLTRMEQLKMIKKISRGFYELIPIKRSVRFIRTIAQRVNYPNISFLEVSHNPVENSAETVDNLAFSVDNLVHNSVDENLLTVDNLRVSPKCANFSPHPVDK